MWAYEFASDDDPVVVAWLYLAKKITVKISGFGAGCSPSEVLVSNARGAAMCFSGFEISL